jgi:hypothetical protein
VGKAKRAHRLMSESLDAVYSRSRGHGEFAPLPTLRDQGESRCGSCMTDTRKMKLFLVAAIGCAVISIFPIAATILGDVLYLRAWNAERVAEQCPSAPDYWQCVSNDPRPISLIFVFFGLIGWALGGFTCLISRYVPPRISSLLLAISILGCCLYLALRRGVADATILGALGALAVLGWLLSPIIGGWLVGLYFRIRNRVRPRVSRILPPP